MEWQQLLAERRDFRDEKHRDQGAVRSAFDQDFDRVIFSRPFRTLQDKTQVIPLPEDDFVHTRLTHSLEVSSVARSLGRYVGQTLIERHDKSLRLYSPSDFGTICSAAALAHDIGNPPFGHSGEAAISEFFRLDPVAQSFRTLVEEKEWEDLCCFEGNAQGFRLLNRDGYQGLQLTFATLGAFSKYPRESLAREQHPARKSQKKYGFFSTKPIFSKLWPKTWA